jgi:hypothetical protein
LTLALLIMLGLWAVTVGTALFVARARLDRDDASLRDELLARGVAFLAASVALFGFGLAATVLTTTSLMVLIAPPAWVLSVLPLFIPSLHRRNGDIRVSSEAWIQVSVVVTVASGLYMSLFILVRLILTGPELV